MTCFVYHVIGTLSWQHIELSLESVARQDVRWDRFVLYNGGDFPDKDILPLVPDCFDSVETFPYDPETPKSASADWKAQIDGISGSERYFVHKADFYLADGVCRRFQEIPPGEWFVLFSKFDMKEHATPDQIRDYASLSWDDAMSLETTGYYEENRGKLAVPFAQGMHGFDGTMHGYTDLARRHYGPGNEELARPWGASSAIQRLPLITSVVAGGDFFAVHMWHEVPEKDDPKKLILGERF